MQTLKIKSKAIRILRKSLYFVGLALVLAVFSSCEDKEEPIGLWGDVIKLSAKYADFSADADSAIITTEGDWWWVQGISINDSSYTSFRMGEVDMESEHYVITEDCFIVERRDKNTLFIQLNENLTGEVRRMTITLEAGDYFDYVGITQAAK